MEGNVFNKYYLRDYLNDRKKVLQEKIDKLEIKDLTDIELIIQDLINKSKIEPIVLKEPRPLNPKETTREVKGNIRYPMETYRQKFLEIFVTIPFDGDYNLFFCYTSPSTIIYLDTGVSIEKHGISFTYTLPQDSLDDKKYQAYVNKIVERLQTNLPAINSDVNDWNKNLEPLIRITLNQREVFVSKKYEFMEKIGLKINPSSDQYLIPNPVTKRVIPKPIPETITSTKKELIQTLQDDVYQDIKQVLYYVGQAVERKPSIYLGKQEEDLRDIFLLFLETRYEKATGVGEAFNKTGKTDILIKYAEDGSNLFVAECKFWRGKKSFLNAIDQLLGYLTHRDSKTALMIFIDQKELTTIIETAKTQIQNHLQFKKCVKDTYNTSISYEFTHPDDSQKTIQMEVMFFHFPKTSTIV